MSFPKAGIKRFNDITGCAPPPGTYDPKKLDKATGGVVEKSERFKAPKDVPAGATDVNATVSIIKTPVKQLFGNGGGNKPLKAGSHSVESAKVKELEKEIRRLVKERVEQDKILSQREEELRKLEGRLSNAQTDKSSLQAKLAAADKELKGTKKSNELLKNKLQSSNTCVKRHEEELQTAVSSLKQQIQTKDQEISSLKRDLELVLATLLADHQSYETMMRTLEENVESYGLFMRKLLSGTITDEEVAPGDGKHNTKTHEEIAAKLKNEKITLEHKMKLVRENTENLKERFSKALSELSALKCDLEGKCGEMRDKQQHLQEALNCVENELQKALEVKRSLEEYRDTLQQSNNNLQIEVQSLTTENQNMAEAFRVVQENMIKLQESRDFLEKQLKTSEAAHLQTHRENASKILALEQLNLDRNGETESLHCRLHELQQTNEEMRERISRTEKVLSETREQNRHITELVREKEEIFDSEKKNLLKQLETSLYEKSQAENLLSETEEKCRTLEASVKILKLESAGQVDGLLEKLKGEMEVRENIQTKMGDLVYEKSQLEMEIGHMEAKIKMITVESEQVKKEAEKTREAIPKFQEQYNCLLLEKEEMEEQAREVNEENTALQSTLKDVQLEFDDYSQKSEQKISQLSDEVAGLTEQRDQMAHDLDDWLTEKSELDIEVAKLQCRVKVLEMEKNQTYEDLEKCIKHYKNELHQVTTEKHQMEKDMEQYGIDLLSNAAEIQSLQAQLLRKCEEHQTLNEENLKMKENLSCVLSKLETASEDSVKLKSQFDRKCEELDSVSKKLVNTDRDLADTRQELLDVTDQLEDAQNSLQRKSKECMELTLRNDELDQELVLSVKETLSLTDHVKSLERYKHFLYAKLISITLTGHTIAQKHQSGTSISSLQQLEERASTEELERYKSLYEDLLAKVEPFMEQIESFELEKQALLGQSKNAQAEVERLSRDYAKLLGHQNQKQKIRHICKIKDENNALKMELTLLRNQCSKQKRIIYRLEEKEQGPKFDPAKSFCHSKENINMNQTAPLKPSNRR